MGNGKSIVLLPEIKVNIDEVTHNLFCCWIFSPIYYYDISLKRDLKFTVQGENITVMNNVGSSLLTKEDH
jgi:hypothetical protein